ncbi:hypothetical protein [Campylobacter porcelli]|uniref:Uncharacterized protein n=1 Tax=Campylobacter porcelli TaxID=1660073 RepID=A0ABU7M631_9BACT|nr:hypothetical protein [Campylobacter sp. CX2-4855-23]MEE3776462.1 hypothetical protein [Campylobacter sp. CX2-4080-23]
MTIKAFKDMILYRIAEKNMHSPNDEMLGYETYEAMLKIANDCYPINLICKDGDNRLERVFRWVNSKGIYLRYPNVPIFDEKDPKYNGETYIDFDEPLNYAVLNEVLFRLSLEKIYRQISDEVVSNYIANSKNIVMESI